MPQIRIPEPNETESKKITPEDFADILQDDLEQEFKERIVRLNLQYRNLSEAEWEEREKWIQNLIDSPKTDASGEHRLSVWEKGWGSNLRALKDNQDNPLVPGYFEKQQDYAAWRGRLVKPLTSNFSYQILGLNVRWILQKYARPARAIYEFGCGTGHHLIQAREINPSANLYGLDWAEASQGIIEEMSRRGILPGAQGKRFDFFNPDYGVVLERESMVYTIAALEQVGTKHDKFIDYLLKNKPEICCHIEPIPESLNLENPLDRWSDTYYKKRNYLSGFLTSLRELEKKGSIKIEKVRRTYVGNFFEGYTLIVWRPVVD
ncbi:MAG TPA: class I SAM-dependent methyltransferase [Candidatus Paceibacterota bacterium]